MSAPRIASLLAALLVVAPADLLAQRQPHVGAGDRVRLWAPRFGIEGSVGTVLALRSDTIVVDRGQILMLAISSLTRLEVSRGQESRAGTGGIVGLVGGAVAGATIGVASWDFTHCDGLPGPDCEREVNESIDSLARATVLGGLLGYGVGALIGSTIKGDRWEEVPLNRLQVTVAPGRRGGFSVGLRVKL